MEIIDEIKDGTAMNGPKLIQPNAIEDDRGFFMESYHQGKFEELGVFCDFIQDNHSKSHKDVLRGLHYQTNWQIKLVRVIQGGIIDIIVDIRKRSQTFGKFACYSLTAKNKRQLFIPGGFAHGFLTLQDNTEVCYKVDEFYDPTKDRGIYFYDPELNLPNYIEGSMSEKDKNLPKLFEIETGLEAEEIIYKNML